MKISATRPQVIDRTAIEGTLRSHAKRSADADLESVPKRRRRGMLNKPRAADCNNGVTLLALPTDVLENITRLLIDDRWTLKSLRRSGKLLRSTVDALDIPRTVNTLDPLELMATRFPNITSLDLGDAAFRHRVRRQAVTAEELAPLSRLAKLRILKIDSLRAYTAGALRVIHGLTKLQTLHLSIPSVLPRELQQPEHFALMSSLPGIVKLEELSGEHVTDNVVAAFADHPQLRDVSIGPADQLTEHGLRALAQAARLKRIRLSRLSVGDQGVQSLGTMPKLEALILSGCPNLTDRAFDAPWPALQTLTISDSINVRGSGLRHFCASGKLRALTINLMQQGEIDTHAIAAVKSLERLQLTHVFSMTDGQLVPLTTLPNVRELYLHGCLSLTPGALAHVANLKMLQSLSISVAHAAKKNAFALLASLPQLRELTISHTHGSDVGDWNGLASLAPLQALEKLRFFGDPMYTLSENDLTAIAGAKNLQSVEITAAAASSTKIFHHLSRLQALRSIYVNIPWMHPLDAQGIEQLKNLHTLSFDGRLLLKKQDGQVLARTARLEELNFGYLSYVEPGFFRALAAAKPLRRLGLRSMSATGLQELTADADGVKLHELSLRDTDKLTDHALSTLRNQTELRSLSLIDVRGVTGSCFAQLAKITDLERLNLRACRDFESASLRLLHSFTKLREIDLIGTKAQDPAALAALAHALPECSIISDHAQP